MYLPLRNRVFADENHAFAHSPPQVLEDAALRTSYAFLPANPSLDRPEIPFGLSPSLSMPISDKLYQVLVALFQILVAAARGFLGFDLFFGTGAFPGKRIACPPACSIFCLAVTLN